jgi:peptide/nickel transport system permease protein
VTALGTILLSRLAKSIAMILIIAAFSFVLVRSAPGDPAQVLAGQTGNADALMLAQVRQEYGLDKPYYVQLALHLRKVVSLDLGQSYRQQMPVSALIMERLPATLLLTGVAFAAALIAGVALGTLAALRAGKVSDTILTVLSLLLYAMPVFWLGLMLVLVFSLKLGWLPAFGYQTIGAEFSMLAHIGDVLAHLALPALSLSAVYVAIYTRLMRASVIDVMDQDFIKTAKAKGLRARVVVARHILRNAIIPVVTVAGMQAGSLIGGAVVVETVFAWPGLGRLTYDALLQRDYPVLLGLFLVMSVLVIALNIATDILYRLVDPRMKAMA